MDFVRTGIGISKTIRNVSRLREVAVIFARHGFSEFITGPLKSYMPSKVTSSSGKRLKDELADTGQKDWGHVIGKRLRLIFEELGPAAIKLGQLLSSREDIFDESFINQMKMLRDKVRPITFEELKPSIESSLEKSLDEIFESINPVAIGTASIGIVFSAKLLSGEDVVIKVKRPNIDRMIQTDFSILLFLINQVEKVSVEVRYLGLSRVIEEFENSLYSELNFNIEAMYCQRLKENLRKHDIKEIFYIPHIYNEYSSSEVLVMERLKGVPFSDTSKIMNYKGELAEKLEEGIKLFLKTFLGDGFFHADLHGGNLFYLESKQIGLLDFGLMGTLGKTSRKNFVAIIYSLLTFNYENLVYEFLDVAQYDEVPDVDKLISDVRTALSPFIGLTVQQTDLSLVLKEVIRSLSRHQLYLPKEWYIVFRSLMTLDGAGKALEIDFDLYSIMEQDIYALVGKVFTKEDLIEDAVWTGKDLLSSAKLFPRHMRWFTKDWAKNGHVLKLDVRGHEFALNQLRGAFVFLGFAFISSIIILCGVLVLGEKEPGELSDIPFLSWLFWIAGITLFLKGLWSLKK